MKKLLSLFAGLLIISMLTLCISQTQIPDSFFDKYQKIENTQTEIDTIFNSYWDQQTKRIEYVTQNSHNTDIDHTYISSLLQSEYIILEELERKNASYSTEISDLYTAISEIQNQDAKTKGNELIISLRNSEQVLGNCLLRYKSATEAVGRVIYYYATDANLSDPEISDEIQSLNSSSRNDFQSGDQFLGQYYLYKEEANSTYQELKKLQ